MSMRWRYDDGFCRDYLLCSVILPQYPVMREPDPILGTNSIIAIDTGPRVELLVDELALERFYMLHQIPAPTRKDLILAMQAWLGLSHNYKNDGYYTFTIPVDRITVTQVDYAPTVDRAVYQVTGVCQVETGGEGAIHATAFFDAAGMLLSVTEKVELIVGIRPICQSTKLLDPDPIVRKMAEQELLVMGISAKEYLFSWRARLPYKLQKAIDQIWQEILKQEEKKQRIKLLLQ